MKKVRPSLPKCYFNYDTLIAKVGNSYHGFEELNCVRVPAFTKEVYERSDAGGGWYGAKELVTYEYTQYFVIMKDDKPFGVLYYPYHEEIKNDIWPVNARHPFKEIKDFINTLITKHEASS